jgi:hypothetical protein
MPDYARPSSEAAGFLAIRDVRPGSAGKEQYEKRNIRPGFRLALPHRDMARASRPRLRGPRQCAGRRRRHYAIPRKPDQQSGAHGRAPPEGLLFRDQGNACDGHLGQVDITPNFADKTQLIQFANDGVVAPIIYSNDFASELSPKSTTDGGYTLTFRDLETRLTGPVDERLTKPRNLVAADSGQWMGWNLANSTTKIEPLHFAAALNEGYRCSYFQTCFTAPLFHPQHVLRLPDKNSRACFMVAQSRPLETYAGVLDPVTDMVPQNDDTALGKIIWQSEFGSAPIGNWNHPGKMSLHGDVLTVAAQNWSEGQGTDE